MQSWTPSFSKEIWRRIGGEFPLQALPPFGTTFRSQNLSGQPGPQSSETVFQHEMLSRGIKLGTSRWVLSIAVRLGTTLQWTICFLTYVTFAQPNIALSPPRCRPVLSSRPNRRPILRRPTHPAANLPRTAFIGLRRNSVSHALLRSWKKQGGEQKSEPRQCVLSLTRQCPDDQAHPKEAWSLGANTVGSGSGALI